MKKKLRPEGIKKIIRFLFI